MCIDAHCTMMGSGCRGVGGWQRLLLLPQVHMARSLANSVGFARIKWELSRIFQAPGSRYFFLSELGSKQRWLLFPVKYLLLRFCPAKWLLQLSGITDNSCLYGLEMTKNVSLFWLSNKMFRNFIGKMMKLILHCSRISKTTCVWT